MVRDDKRHTQRDLIGQLGGKEVKQLVSHVSLPLTVMQLLASHWPALTVRTHLDVQYCCSTHTRHAHPGTVYPHTVASQKEPL